MYLKRIALRNLGPTESIDIVPRFTEQGAPIPIAIVGRNGAGKSLVLSTLLDACVEAKKKIWNSIPEITPEKYIRLSSKTYIRTGSKYSLSEVEFGREDAGFVHTEFVCGSSRDEFVQAVPGFSWSGKNVLQLEVNAEGFGRVFTPKGDFTPELKKSLFLFFPYFRYESPAWLNFESELRMSLNQAMSGVETESLIQVDVVEKLATWLLDLILDREIYEAAFVPAQIRIEGQHEFSGQYRVGTVGPNTNTVVLLQQILTEIFKSKDPSITRARFGISHKKHRSISVHVYRGADDTEEVAAPRLQQLSSGELMLLSLFSSILRSYDSVHSKPAATLEEVKGVVFIDEIDLHLHISLQREVLPQVIRMLPNVQFVMSTHSPFFLLGLAKDGDQNVDIYDFPTGVPIAASEFSEFRTGYDVFVEKNQQFLLGFENLRKKISNDNRPLLITEGKTDWKHLKAALLRLKASAEFADLDVEFLEFEDDVDMGDAKLAQMCEYLAHVPQPRKLIFVFDRDVPTIVAKMAGQAADGFKRWNDSVISMCIPVPQHRRDYRNISIEFFYSDDEVKTRDRVSGTRLFFSNELELYRNPGQPEKVRVLQEPHHDGELEKKIFDKDCARIRDADGNPAAHSKAAFADHVLHGHDGFANFELESFRTFFASVSVALAGPRG
ncbi:AAA family ATPase [Cupriavidus sp.]|uniref:AAA family ATPase n=1 Tax=Cupriavidus sp. TaxID=1873897 RepID=UPI003D0D682E